MLASLNLVNNKVHTHCADVSISNLRDSITLTARPPLPPTPFSLGCIQYSTQKAEERLLCILLNANQRVIMGEAWERGYQSGYLTVQQHSILENNDHILARVVTFVHYNTWSYFRVLSHTWCQRSLVLGVRVERVEGFMASTFRQANSQRILSGLERGEIMPL